MIIEKKISSLIGYIIKKLNWFGGLSIMIETYKYINKEETTLAVYTLLSETKV